MSSHRHNWSPNIGQKSGKAHELYQLSRNTSTSQQPPVSQSSLKSTDYVHSLEVVQPSLQSDPTFDRKLDQPQFNQTAHSMDSLQTSPKFNWSKFNQTAQSMDSLQTSLKFNWSKFDQTAQEEHRAATKAKSGTEHKVSSPKNPQSNGMAERCVQTMKASLLKTIEEGEDVNLALLTYKTTPLNHSLPSPAELLNSRKYKTLLPTC